MIIKKVDLEDKLENMIEEEQQRYETQNGVAFTFMPFSFVAKESDEIVGAITGFTCYSEVYIDELVVMEKHRGKNIGTQLIKTVEEYYKNDGFNNINLCTNEFQAPHFYEKCGFELEFVRKNKANPQFNKYFYVKYF